MQLKLYVWLVEANPYCISSHCVNLHTNLVCCLVFINIHKQHKNDMNKLMLLYEWYAIVENIFKTIKLTVINNVCFCMENKSKHYSTSIYIINITNCFLKINNYFFSTTKYYLGPSIKWWGGIGYEVKRSNISVYATIIKVKLFSKCHKSYDLIYRVENMDEASSTRNMEICVVDENEIITSSQEKLSLFNRKPKEG